MKCAAAAAALVLMPCFAAGAIKTEPIPDLRPPRQELPPLPEKPDRLPWIFGGTAFALVAVLMFWPRRKPAPPPPSPYEVAQSALAAMRGDGSLATPTAISATLRQFAARAFDLSGGGVTAEEVASGLAARRNCPTELASEVWQFLAECDVAKFAPGAPSPAVTEMLDRADRLVESLETARATAARTL
jgi:hypothetical protein